jgi:hypothetical protein
MKTKLVNRLEFGFLMFLLMVGRLSCNGDEPTNQMPSDEVRYNEANPKMIWGDTTNFLRGQFNGGPLQTLQTVMRSGIDVNGGIIILSGHPLEAAHPAQFCIEDCLGPLFYTPTYDHGVPGIPVDPTNVIYCLLPPLNERFDITMTNSDGAPVLKTPEGRRLGKPVSLKSYTEWSPHSAYKQLNFLGPKEVLPMAFSDISQATPGMNDLDLTKYFKIRKKGYYKLTITQRLYVMDTNTYLKAVTLPPVTVPVRVENDVKE